MIYPMESVSPVQRKGSMVIQPVDTQGMPTGVAERYARTQRSMVRPWRVSSAMHVLPDAEASTAHTASDPHDVQMFFEELRTMPRLQALYERARTRLHYAGQAIQRRRSDPRDATRAVRRFLEACQDLEEQHAAHPDPRIAERNIRVLHEHIGMWLATWVQGGADLASVISALHATSHGWRRAARYHGVVKQWGDNAPWWGLMLLQRPDWVGTPEELKQGASPAGCMINALHKQGRMNDALAHVMHIAIHTSWGIDATGDDTILDVWENWLALHANNINPNTALKKTEPPEAPKWVPMPLTPFEPAKALLHPLWLKLLKHAHSGFRGAAAAQQLAYLWRSGALQRASDTSVQPIQNLLETSRRPSVAWSVCIHDLRHIVGHQEEHRIRHALRDTLFGVALGQIPTAWSAATLQDIKHDEHNLHQQAHDVFASHRPLVSLPSHEEIIQREVNMQHSRQHHTDVNKSDVYTPTPNDPSRVLLMKGRTLEFDLKADRTGERAAEYLLKEQRDRRRDLQWMILARQLFLEHGNQRPAQFPGNAALVLDAMLSLAQDDEVFSMYLQKLCARLPRDPLLGRSRETSIEHIMQAASSAPWPHSVQWHHCSPALRTACFIMAVASQYRGAAQHRLMQYASYVTTHG